MTSSELAAFNAGLRHAIGMAQLAALQIELRPGAGHIRQRAAIEALRGLAEGLKIGLPDKAQPCIDPTFAGREAEPKHLVSAYDNNVLG